MDIVRRGRLDATDQDAAAFLSSMEDDEPIFEADVRVGQAHVVMLAEQGVIVDGDAARILDALQEVREAGFEALPDAEDVHPAIEQAVIDRAGEEVGGQLHTARSRNDEVATCIRIRLREEILGLTAELLGLREALLERAGETEDWVMPGYTHLQRAQPTTMGHHLASYAHAFERDTARLLDAYRRVNECPLGSAAFAGTGFPINRQRTAELLGFNQPTRNSMDGVASRDFLVESVGAAANHMITLSRLCEDLVVWSTREFGYLELGDAYSSTSSIMPQKKNPDTLELARGKAGSVQAALTALHMNLKGQPMAYNRDLQEATPHTWRAYGAARDSVRVLRGAVESMEFDREALREAADGGFVGATALADALVREGVPFRTAHHVVAVVARNHDASEIDASVVRDAAEEVGVKVSIEDEEVETVLDPERYVERLNSFGGPGELGEALGDARDGLEHDVETLEDFEMELENADDELAAAIREVEE